MAESDLTPVDSLFFYLTDRCNLKCKHCWIPTKWNTTTSDNELTTEECLSVVDKAIPLNLRFVKFTGGEPLLRKDLGKLLFEIHKRNIGIHVETNGTLINEEIAQVFAQTEAAVSVSLDAIDAEMHDEFRGVKGAFQQALNGINKLSKNKVNTSITMCLYKINRTQLEPLAKWCHERGFHLKINPIIPEGRAKKFEESGDLFSVQEKLKLAFHIEDLRKKYGYKVQIHLPLTFHSLEAIRKHQYYKCGFKNLLSVLANGDISLCGMGYNHPHTVMGNIRRNDLIDIWKKHKILLTIRENLPKNLNGVCSKCVFNKSCLGDCRAIAFECYGSFCAPSPDCQALYDAGLFPSTRLRVLFNDR